MKRLSTLSIVAVAAALCVAPAVAGNDCTTIRSGEIYDSAGDVLAPGYDVWGYNYQAHKFNGFYCDAYRDASWCQAYKDVELAMKWNDAWLSNKDCDEDQALDRHYGFTSYIGSGAWLTNHQKGYYDKDGRNCRWTYFVKIVAAPSDATLIADTWYDGTGDVIGQVVWGSFAIVQQVYNDPCEGITGLEFKGARPGLGNWEDP